MNKVFFILAIFLMSSFIANAQNSGKGFNYQAIARNQNGQVLQNETIILRFSLIRQNETEPTWQEIQAAVTDELGVFSLTIGQGQRTGGSVDLFNQVNFAGLPFWLKVELNDDEDYFEISFRELMSVPYAEVAFNAVACPTGMITPFGGPISSIPEGWFLCDGSLKSKNDYPELYAAIGNSWGGDATQFRLPDCQGMFLRGVANGSTNDPDRTSRVPSNTGGLSGDNVGSKQFDETKKPASFSITIPVENSTWGIQANGSHRHGFSDAYFSENISNPGTKLGSNDSDYDNKVFEDSDNTNYGGIHIHNTTGWDNETRPINVYVNYIIKY